MFKVKFKGSFDDLEVENSTADALMELLNEKNPPEMVDINGGMYHLKSVKAVQPVGKSSPADNKLNKIKEEHAEHIEKINEEYQQEREISLRLSPEERGKNLNIFNLVWFAETGKQEVPESVIPKIIELQTQFFKDNPTLTEANPICYKEIVTAFQTNEKGNKNYKYMGETARRAAMEIVERTLHTDMYNSK